jgi:hypothetical protein
MATNLQRSTNPRGLEHRHGGEDHHRGSTYREYQMVRARRFAALAVEAVPDREGDRHELALVVERTSRSWWRCGPLEGRRPLSLVVVREPHDSSPLSLGVRLADPLPVNCCGSFFARS